MYSLTIALGDADKLAYIASLVDVIAGDGLNESLPQNIVVANDWYSQCLSDRVHSMVDENDEMIRDIVMHLRRAADVIEKAIGKPRDP